MNPEPDPNMVKEDPFERLWKLGPLECLCMLAAAVRKVRDAGKNIKTIGVQSVRSGNRKNT